MHLAIFAFLLIGVGHGAEVGFGAAEHINVVNDTLAAVQMSVRPSSHVVDKAMSTGHAGSVVSWWISFLVNLLYARRMSTYYTDTDMMPKDDASNKNKWTIIGVLVLELVGIVFMLVSTSTNFKRVRNNVMKRVIWPIIYIPLTIIDVMYMELATENTILADLDEGSLKTKLVKYKHLYDINDSRSIYWALGRLALHVVNIIVWWPTSIKESKESNKTDSSLMQMGALLRKLGKYRANAIARFNKTRENMAEGGDTDRVTAALGSRMPADEASWASMEAIAEKVASSGFDASLEHAFKQVDRWVDTHGMESLLQLEGHADFPMDESKTDEFINTAKGIYDAVSPSLLELKEGSDQFKMPRHAMPDHRSDDIMGMVKAADGDLEELQHLFEGSSQGGI